MLPEEVFDYSPNSDRLDFADLMRYATGYPKLATSDNYGVGCLTAFSRLIRFEKPDLSSGRD